MDLNILTIQVLSSKPILAYCMCITCMLALNDRLVKYLKYLYF